jgi:LysR family nod box-dependent transcriptional activator
MHLDNFDLNLLVALDALLTEKHVTRAADKLHVTQPAMSAALARLRAYFDDQLLMKVGAGLELTPRAQDLVGEVRELIFRIRTTLRTKPTFDPSTGEREMRLIMSDYAAMVYMPGLASSLLETAPGVRCVVENLATDTLTRVDHGVADFCITIEQRELFDDSPGNASLNGELLFEDEFVAVVDASSDAAKSVLTREAFLKLPYIEVRFAHTVFSIIDAPLRREGLVPRAAVVIPSFTQAAGLISGTNMIAIIPRRLACSLTPASGLSLLQPPISLPPIRETLIWHKRNDADPAHRWFRSHLHAVAARHNLREGSFDDPGATPEIVGLTTPLT